MSEEIKKTGDLLDGLAATPPEPVQVMQAGQTPPVPSNCVTDSLGVAFDPAIHRVDEFGAPVVGSKKQFLLKKEAKKSAKQWLKDGFSKIWNGEKQPEQEIPEENELPLSDHEFNQIPLEKQENEFSEPAQRSVILSSSAENSADLFFVGGSMLVGIEFLNQRQRFHPQAAAVIAEYERRTGKGLDLPPGVALALGLGRIGYEIIQREPACKAKFENGVKVIRDNAGKYVRSKIPFLNKSQPAEEPRDAA